MIDILKRIFIGVAIGMSIFFIKSFCFALSYDLSYDHAITVFDNNSLSFNATIDGSDKVSTLTFTYPFSTTKDYIAGFSFTSSYINNATGNVNFNYADVTYRINLMSSSGSWEQCEVQNNFIICPVVANKTYTGLRFYYGAALYSGNSIQEFMVRLNTTVMFFNSLLTESSQASNDVLNETKKITDETDRSGNGDSYDSTGIDSNEDKEDALTSNAESSINNFSIDLSSNANAFEYIFFLLDKFVKANSKVFGALLSILGFGFIKLVLGR